MAKLDMFRNLTPRLISSTIFSFLVSFLILLGFGILSITAQIPQAKIKDEDSTAKRRQDDLPATRNDFDPRPLVKNWEYLTTSPTRFPIKVSGRAALISLLDGRVAALSVSDGNLLWETPPGGECTAPIGLGASEIYVASERPSSNGKEGVLRALDLGTGITRWTVTLPQPVVSTPIEAENLLYVVLSNGNLSALRRGDGGTQWTLAEQTVSPESLLVADKTLYAGLTSGILMALKADSGEKIWQVQASGTLGNPAVDADRIYVGSSDGQLVAVNRKQGKLVWKRRMGAAVQAAPVVKEDQVLVVSFDNFLYALNPKNGSQFWRQQMAGRLTSSPVFWGNNTLAVAAFDSNEVTLLEPEEGDVTARLQLGEGRILAALTVADDLLIVPSDHGAVATRLLSLQATETAKDIKKQKRKGKKQKENQ